MSPYPVPAEDAPSEVRHAYDSIVNWMSGLGGLADKARASQWAFAITENWQSLTNLYRSSWLARKIVRARADDMLRAGFDLDWDGHDKNSDDVDAVKRAITRWGLISKLREALYWSNLYGGSVITLGCDDMKKPLPVVDGLINFEQFGKGKLRYLHVFDRWRANHGGVIDSDIASPNAGKPVEHVIAASETGENGTQVNWTKVVRFDGALVPWITWRSNAMWHDSELQAVIEVLRSYDSTTSNIASLIFEANVDVLKANGITKALTTAGGIAALQERYAMIAAMKSNNRIMVIDKEKEDYDRKPFQFSGLDRIWEKIMLDVAGASSYPVTRLFGQAPAGLNATGDSDIRNYYDDVMSRMEIDLRPRLAVLLEVIIRNELGRMPDGFEFTFRPLWQQTELEKSQIGLNHANRDKTYFDCGAVTGGLLARQLKNDGTYATMEDDDVDMAVEMDQQAQQTPEQAAALLGKGAKPPQPIGTEKPAAPVGTVDPNE